MSSPDTFMYAALHNAHKAYHKQEVPVGAVIVYNNTIIASAHNSVQQLQDPTAHAELIALREACAKLQAKYLPSCSLYVTLEPCPMCAQAMYWTQLGSLTFAAQDPKRGYQLWDKPLLHPKTKVQQGLMAQPSTQLLQTFFQERRKTSLSYKHKKKQ